MFVQAQCGLNGRNQAGANILTDLNETLHRFAMRVMEGYVQA